MALINHLRQPSGGRTKPHHLYNKQTRQAATGYLPTTPGRIDQPRVSNDTNGRHNRLVLVWFQGCKPPVHRWRWYSILPQLDTDRQRSCVSSILLYHRPFPSLPQTLPNLRMRTSLMHRVLRRRQLLVCSDPSVLHFATQTYKSTHRCGVWLAAQ